MYDVAIDKISFGEALLQKEGTYQKAESERRRGKGKKKKKEEPRSLFCFPFDN